jgi:hypothetical protein
MSIAAVSLLIPLIAHPQASKGPVRSRISLDGEWDLVIPSKNAQYKITVPGSWQAQIPELRNFVGRGIYVRQFTVPDSWFGKRVFLCFGAVDYRAEVYVNERNVGSHEGGYTPFEFDITDSVKLGQPNNLAVHAVDAGKGNPVEGIRFEEIPHGKQSWYGNTSGIWQSVWLEARHEYHIARVIVNPDVDNSTASICVQLAQPTRGQLRISFVPPPGAEPVPPLSLELSETTRTAQCDVRIPSARLWSPESPALYTVHADLIRDGLVVDSVATRFGMRKIEAKDGKILLNNEPIFLAGALDQDFYPITEYTPPSADYIRDQFLKAKHMGLNLMRCHIKVPDPRYLDLADELGLLVWYEIPNWIDLSEDAKRRAKQTLAEMLERDHNHPSLVIISIINESWGVNMADDSHRQWIAEMYDYAKALEPSRLIVDNSACGGNFHVKTDIEDFHAYFQIPDQAPEFAGWIEQFSKHPDWTFGAGAKRRGFEPLVLSEFGNWGLPRLSNLAKVYGTVDPWWFSSSRSHSSEVTLPAGVQERFRQYCLDKVFGTLDGLADAFQDQEWLALKYQIEEIRKRDSIVGYVITEFTDLQWESNGLLDYCRNPKTFHHFMHTLQEQDVVIATPKRFNFAAGEEIELLLWISHFSSRDLSSCKIVYETDFPSSRGEIPLQIIPRASSRKVGLVRLVAPEINKPLRGRLDVSLVDQAGRALISNYAEYALFPSEPPTMPEHVIVSSSLDRALVDRVRAGACAVVCFESAQTAPTFKEGLRIVDRGESRTWGSWCNSLIWFRTTSPAFSGVPIPKTMDFSFENIIPNCIIMDVDPKHWENDVLSGIFVGWVHSNAAVLVQLRCGCGRILLTTLPLISASKSDPMANFLLASLARYVASEECQPKFEHSLEFVQTARR